MLLVLTNNRLNLNFKALLQTQKIRACLWGSQITVDSVESYQGSERRVTILTLTRSEHIGFLSEYKADTKKTNIHKVFPRF